VGSNQGERLQGSELAIVALEANGGDRSLKRELLGGLYGSRLDKIRPAILRTFFWVPEREEGRGVS